MVYEPAEDSFLISKCITSYAKGRVLDMGTGSGILAKEAARSADEVVAADIDLDAATHAKKDSSISFIHSDLFTNITGEFDLILFNPPYLPDDEDSNDIALHGGKKGHEVIERFLSDAPGFLKKDGVILLLFSTLTGKDKVEELIRHKSLAFEEIAKQNLWFETLFVYKIERTSLAKGLYEIGLKNISFSAKGQRGVVFTGCLDDTKVAIKATNNGIVSDSRIKHEVNMLRKVNLHGIGPKLLHSGEGYFVMDFIEGCQFLPFIMKSSPEKVKDALQDIFRQLKDLDALGLSKEEMHRPIKHIFVGQKPVLIDFERARFTQRPSNITQFCKYLMSKDVYPELEKKGLGFSRFILISLLRKYKAGGVKAEKIISYILDKSFDEQVWDLTAKIPKGKITTYKAIADALGTKAYRAVGGALNRNPYAPEIPCHRVVDSKGHLHGYASGLAKKAKILMDEGIEIKDNRVVSFTEINHGLLRK